MGQFGEIYISWANFRQHDWLVEMTFVLQVVTYIRARLGKREKKGE